jgi:large subunit ribosomal protein L33
MAGRQVERRERTMVREMITLACTECKRRNYATRKNKTRTTDRLEMKKYCPFDRKHVVHKEVR